jgi:hypothetical protein
VAAQYYDREARDAILRQGFAIALATSRWTIRLEWTSKLLEMALVGYEAERQRIDAAIAALRKQIGGRESQ